MVCCTPGFPVHHQLPEFTQTHVHWVGDAIQSSHPLLSPSPAFKLFQHQGLFHDSLLEVTLLLLLFSHSVMSDSLWPHGLQHTRLPHKQDPMGPSQDRPSPISSALPPLWSTRYYYLMQISWVVLQMWTPPLKHQMEELLVEPEHIAPGLLQPKE